MEDNNPGAPPPNEGKLQQNPKKVTFRIEGLSFLYAHSEKGVSYLTFIYNGEFILTMKKWEYFELLDRVYTLVEGEDDIVIDITPEFELIEEHNKIAGMMMDMETNTTQEFDKYIPHYIVFDLTANLSADIIDSPNLN